MCDLCNIQVDSSALIWYSSTRPMTQRAAPNLRTRASGVLLHPTSLPGPAGIGDLGQPALRFAEQLASARQTWWQTLPIGPTGFGNSPYSALSSSAGTPLLVSLER